MEDVMSALLAKIKDKKELRTIADEYALARLQSYLQKQKIQLPSTLVEKQFFKNKLVKQVIADVRSELRTVYGVFKREQTQTTDDFSAAHIRELLLHHQSSYERINLYPQIYAQVFEELDARGLPQDYTLLDLACGYNPLSYIYLPRLPSHCRVGDLSHEDMHLLQTFFIGKKIRGTASYLDLLDETAIAQVIKDHYDVCFLFKALDSLEIVKRHSSKKLLTQLDCSFFVISFALITIGGKNSIGTNKRWWLEAFCEKQGWKVSSFSVENELFYIVKK